eukprot:CAMPEP_0115456276 /NCGR_PEP_ID=MMETSP0271-20121206/44600_1 /TAXON_ID=71861 /ORGANISM="Scrippsiella trochoidea, Strain CCMP3099" /LENGTH=113 /DNA_ID=CAMNT_0002882777 /DNA_START=349 /DNA_END=686 /DNA_ORIENTATION=+
MLTTSRSVKPRPSLPPASGAGIRILLNSTGPSLRSSARAGASIGLTSPAEALPKTKSPIPWFLLGESHDVGSTAGNEDGQWRLMPSREENLQGESIPLRLCQHARAVEELCRL